MIDSKTGMFEAEFDAEFNVEAFIRHAPILVAARRHGLLSKVLAYLEEHVRERIPLPWVAKAVGLEPSSLSRLCTRELGVSCKTLINTYRIYRAVRIIWEEDLEVGSVGSRVGILDQASFCRTFKSITGLTPSTFKQVARALEWRNQYAILKGSRAHVG